MEKPSEAETESYRQFLEEFCKSHKGIVTSKDTLPFRLSIFYLSESEAEGECLDLALQYLLTNKCPHHLALSLARAVTDDVLKEDLTSYVVPPEELEESGVGTGAGEDDDESDIRQLEAERFAELVLNKVHQLAGEWQSLLPPVQITDKKYDLSVFAIKNTRRKMEDRHVVLPNLNAAFGWKEEPEQSYFAVFDGHGGVDAANYAAAHLHCNMVRSPKFRTDPTSALREGFRRTDDQFVKKAEREHLHSGSTGVCTLIRDNRLYVAWLGDSQTILVRDGRPVELMDPHKPEREDEKRRIEKLGGCVVWFGAWRVNGSLSVSRAIGDPQDKQYIIGEPDVATFDLDGTEDYLVLACDGMWDTLTPDDVVTLVHSHLQENNGDRSKVAQKLVKTARDKGSNDNISVIVYFLRNQISAPKTCRSEKSEEISENDKKSSDEEKKDAEKQEPGADNDEGSASPDLGFRFTKGGSNRGSSNKETSFGSPYLQRLASSGVEDSDSPGSNFISDQSASHKVIISSSPGEVSSHSTNPSADKSEMQSSHSTIQSLEKADVHSGTSTAAELALLSKTANRCVSNRKAKRSKAGRNGSGTGGGKNGNGKNGKNGHHTKENKVVYRSKTLGPFTQRTLYRTPIRSRSAESNLGLQRTLVKNSDQMLHMLTGWSPAVIRKAKSPSKWTVAVEVDASAMFAERNPLGDNGQRYGRKTSDTPLYKGKK